MSQDKIWSKSLGGRIWKKQREKSERRGLRVRKFKKINEKL